MQSFEKVSSVLATFAGVAAFLYSLSFVVVTKNSPVAGGVLAALFLMIFGILASGAWVGLYRKLRDVDPGFALWIMILALFGAMGAFVHGGYDLTNTLNPPAILNSDLASQIDPRGLLTFGLSGLALMLTSLTLGVHPQMSKNLSNLGYLTGVLSVFLYLARLIILDTTSPIITIPAAVEGFVLTPLWYVWVGRKLKANGLPSEDSRPTRKSPPKQRRLKGQ